MIANKYSVAKNRHEKVLSFKTTQGSVISTTRELYLRPDIPCGVKNCTYCPKTDVPGLKAVTNLLVIDGPTLLHFWELFLLDDFYGVVVTQSSLNYVLQNSPSNRLYNKIRYQLMNCADDKLIYFTNEFSSECFSPQKKDESLKEWTKRLNQAAFHLFVNHFHENVKVNFASTSPEDDNNELIAVIKEYYKESIPVNSLYENLKRVMELQRDNEDTGEMKIKPGYAYPEHLTDAEIHAGLKSKQFLKGTIRVSPFRPNEEAVVCLSELVLL